MWEIYVTWLPVFGVILGGAILAAGIVSGGYRSCQHILGYSNEYLFGYAIQGKYLLKIYGIVPVYLLTCAGVSIIGGTFAAYLVRYAPDREVGIIYGMMAGGVFGVGILYAMKGLTWLAENDRKVIAEVMTIGIGGIAGWVAAGRTGAVVGLIASAFTMGAYAEPFENDDITGLIPGAEWIAGVVAGGSAGAFIVSEIAGKFTDKPYGDMVLGVAIGVLTGVITGMLTGAVVAAVFFLVKTISGIVSFALSPLLILSRWKTMICSRCLLYTNRFQASYENGKRFCEHCNNELEWSDDPGKVVFTFGNIQITPCGRVFMISDPNVAHKHKRIDVSEVYIDPKTADQLLIERFLTYIVNYPPTNGLESVHVSSRGDLKALDKNLKNALRNTFGQIEQMDTTCKVASISSPGKLY